MNGQNGYFSLRFCTKRVASMQQKRILNKNGAMWTQKNGYFLLRYCYQVDQSEWTKRIFFPPHLCNFDATKTDTKQKRSNVNGALLFIDNNHNDTEPISKVELRTANTMHEFFLPKIYVIITFLKNKRRALLDFPSSFDW